MSDPKPYRIEMDNAYEADGMLSRLPERCERLARVTITTTLTEEELEQVRAEGGRVTALPVEATMAEMNDTLQEIAEALNRTSLGRRWEPRDASQLGAEQRQALERLVAGHYGVPPVTDDQERRIEAHIQIDESDLTGILASYGLSPETVLIDLTE